MKNDAFNSADKTYYTNFKAWMFPHISAGANTVLDVGCASGVFGRELLKAGKASTVFGVEIFDSAAAEARKHYKEVFVGDIEEMDLPFDHSLDYIVCGDVLEHLKRPELTLRKMGTWLKPGGAVLVCVPNVRNYHVVRSLLFRGHWTYTDAGIMDRTHLRFFTKHSCEAMVRDAGFQVVHSSMVIEGPKKRLFNRCSAGLAAEFLASQTFVVGRMSK